MPEYHFNCVAIARFRMKPEMGEILEFAPVGNLRETLTYVDVGRYAGNFYDSMAALEVYEIDFSGPPGFSYGIVEQNESAFTLGVKDLDGNWVDPDGTLSFAVHRLGQFYGQTE